MWSLVAMTAFGFLTWWMARQRGRNQVVGFILGFFFMLFAVVGYLIIGDTQDLADEKMVAREKKLEKMRGAR